LSGDGSQEAGPKTTTLNGAILNPDGKLADDIAQSEENAETREEQAERGEQIIETLGLGDLGIPEEDMILFMADLGLLNEEFIGIKNPKLRPIVQTVTWTDADGIEHTRAAGPFDDREMRDATFGEGTAEPLYKEGAESIGEGWSTELVRYYQDKLVDANLLGLGTYRPGMWGPNTEEGIRALMGLANMSGGLWQDAFATLEKFPVSKPDIPAWVRPTPVGPDAATLHDRISTEFMSSLGREPSRGEMGEFVEYLDTQYEVAQAVLDKKARRESIDAGIASGGMPSLAQQGFLDDQPKQIENVDIEARFRQFFRERTRGKVQQREHRSAQQAIPDAIAGTIQAGGN